MRFLKSKALFPVGASNSRIQTIIDSSWVSVFGQMTNSTVMYFYLWGVVNTVWMTVWYASVIGYCAFFSWVNRNSKPRPGVISTRGIRAISKMAVIGGLPWGILSVVVMFSVPIENKMVPYVLLAGMAAGGTLIMSPIPIASVIYTSIIILPTIVLSLFVDYQNDSIVSFSLLLYIFILGYFTSEHSKELWKNEHNEKELEKQFDIVSKAHDELEKITQVDHLTGLANRQHFTETVTQTLKKITAQGSHKLHPLLLFDLDHFKAINDGYGHEIGDAYLRAVAKIIDGNLGPDWITARLGGDEFAAFCIKGVEPWAVEHVSAKLVADSNRKYMLENLQMEMRCSIGMSVAIKHSSEFKELMNFADRALIRAKECGRGRFVCFDDQAIAQLLFEQQEIQELLSDLENGDFYMVYQAQYEALTGNLHGLEALVRWRMKSGKVQTADKLFDYAKRSGKTFDLCNRIMKELLEDIPKLRARGYETERLSVNIDPVQLQHADVLLKQLGEMRDVAGDMTIVLEITEDCVIGRGTENMPKILRRIADEGFELSLDDFGTGYASLSHLADLPITEIKIDKHFVLELQTNQMQFAILDGIHRIASQTGLRMIIEGVETHAQLVSIAKFKDVVIQGYYFSAPSGISDLSSRYVDCEERQHA